jgi:DNA-binding NarL/FixJ family response regulator
MSEMGGEQCLAELLRMNPAVKVLTASGFSAKGPREDTLAAGAEAFVSKPYNIQQLLEAVREVLDRD